MIIKIIMIIMIIKIIRIIMIVKIIMIIMIIKIITSMITQNNDERKTKGLLITLWDAKIFRYNTHKLNMGSAFLSFFNNLSVKK